MGAIAKQHIRGGSNRSCMITYAKYRYDSLLVDACCPYDLGTGTVLPAGAAGTHTCNVLLRTHRRLYCLQEHLPHLGTGAALPAGAAWMHE
jgi:hypothetical protein